MIRKTYNESNETITEVKHLLETLYNFAKGTSIYKKINRKVRIYRSNNVYILEISKAPFDNWQMTTKNKETFISKNNLCDILKEFLDVDLYKEVSAFKVLTVPQIYKFFLFLEKMNSRDILNDKKVRHYFDENNYIDFCNFEVYPGDTFKYRSEYKKTIKTDKEELTIVTGVFAGNKPYDALYSNLFFDLLYGRKN